MPVGSRSAEPSTITTFNLPTGCLLDTASLKLHFTATCTGAVQNATNVRAKLPADGSSLIQRLNVSINGVSVQNACSEYNTVARLCKIANSSREREISVDRATSNGVVDTTNGADQIADITIAEFKGVLSESSARFWPMGALGDCQIELTWSGNEVLVPKADGVGFAAGDNLSGDARTAAANIRYAISNLYMSCDTIQFGNGLYDQMLADRLSREESIPILFKDYFTFSQDGVTGNAFSTRFSVSASSIDRIFCTTRNSNHRTTGVRGHTLVNHALGDGIVANYFKFSSYDTTASNSRSGTLRLDWQINNTPHPTFKQSVQDLLSDLAYQSNKVGPHSLGIIPTSMESYQDGLYVAPLLLAHPSESVVQYGYDSRGATSQMSWDVAGITIPAAVAASQTLASISAFVCIQVTSEMKISLGREVVVAH
jgi:hypothetical protein